MRAIAISFCLTIAGVAAAFLFWEASLVPYSGSDAYFRQPGFFPVLALSAVLLFGVILALRYGMGSPIPEDEELVGTRPQLRVLAPLVIGFAAYAALTPVIGYLASTLLFAVSGLLIGRRMNRWSCLTVLVLSATLYFVFVVYLDVWFSAPTLFEMMGALQ